MNLSQIVGDIDMGTIDPTKSNVMVECNHEREEFGSSKRFKGIEEINEKKLTYVVAIHIDEVDKNHRNWDNLWEIANTLLSNIVEENENATKECINEDVHDVEVDAKVILQFCYVFYDFAVILYFTRKLPFVNWIKLCARTHSLTLLITHPRVIPTIMINFEIPINQFMIIMLCMIDVGMICIHQ